MKQRGVGARGGGEGGGAFFPSLHPPRLPVSPAPVFGIAALILPHKPVKTARPGGAVSHFQGPLEHMRHSWETGGPREGVAI